MQKSSIWRIATAVLVLGSIVYTSRSGAKSGQRRRKESDYNDNVLPEYEQVFNQNLIIPDGWTFGVVWPTIYAGTAALSVYQALPNQQNNPRYVKAAPYLAVNYIINALFGRFFSDPNPESIIASNVITQLNLPAGLALHKSLEIGQTSVAGTEKYLRWPISLYAGWLTAATVLGTPNIFLKLGWWKPDLRRDVPLAMGLLGATGAVGYTVARRLNGPVYLIPFVAGFSGIATHQYGKQNSIAAIAGGLALLYAGILVKWLPQGTFHPVPVAASTPVNQSVVSPEKPETNLQPVEETY